MNENLGSRNRHHTPVASSPKGKSQSPAAVKTIFKILFIILALSFAILFIVGSAAAGLVGGGAFAIIKTTPMLDAALFSSKGLNSYVYDADGNIIAELKKDENRVEIEYDDIPQMLIDAYIAVEDKRFKEHKGIDYRRIGSAIISYGRKLLGQDVEIQGGSTITQQLIKNITDKDDITIPRKLQEQWQALELEKVLTKEEIITYYLNNVPLGHNFYGVETAAKGYYGKDVRELSLAECASLASITQNPSKYMPIDEDNMEANLTRTKLILGLMQEQGMISQSEYDEAVSEKIAFDYNPEAGKVMRTSNQPYFVDEVIDDLKSQLMVKYNISQKAVTDWIYGGGLHIYATMQPKVQNALDKVFTDPKYFSFDNKFTDETAQAAMVVIDKDGFVRGLYGGRGEKKGDVYNRATMTERPPGSSIKPLLIYGPGIDSKTITAATVVDDVKQYLLHDKPEEEWPRNVEKNNYGLTGVREGLFRSRNVVATLLLKDKVGLDNALNYLARLGLDRKNERYLSIAMGGFNKGMSPLQMAAAYTVYANKGVYTAPMFITVVKDSTGKEILSVKPARTQVFSEQTVYIMNNMMEDVVKKGTGYPEGIIKYKDAKGKEVTITSAGKTGTTDSNKDKWFAGFTPYYVGVSWYGYDKAVEIEKGEQNSAKIIWSAVMNELHKNMAPANFFDSVPPNIVKRTICLDSGKIATDLCRADPRGNRVREELFIQGTEPAYSDTCTVHVKVRVCTASKDALGRELLATEFCPIETTFEKIGIRRPVEYKPKFPTDKYPADAIYEIPEGEFCTVHGKGALLPPENEEITPPIQEDVGDPLTEGPGRVTPSPGVGMVDPQNEDIGDPIEEQNWDEIDWGSNPGQWD